MVCKCSESNPCLGDFDGDGDVDSTDNAFFMAQMGRTWCMQVTGLEMDKDYWYRLMTEVEGGQRLSVPAYINSRGKVQNIPPVITSTPVLDAIEGSAYEYDAEANDPEGTSLVFQLDIAPGGMQIDPVTGIVTRVPERDQAGVQDVMVRVTDEDGISATQFFQIVVLLRANSAPMVDPGGPYCALTGENISFAADASDPEGDPVVTWRWAFGDGALAEGREVTHSYAAAGTYTVSLFVTDDRGATGHAETVCRVDLPDRPPVADAGGPYTGFAGVPLLFDGAGSYDPDDDILTYTWNFGDSTPAQSGVQVFHTFASAGTYAVSLSVDDGRGGLDSVQAEVVIQPPNQAPDVDFIVSGGLYTGVTLTFDASSYSDPDGHDIVFYEWDFGDGQQTTGILVSHTYADSGSYTVTLTVTDSYGMSGNSTAELAIADAPGSSTVADVGGD